MFWHLAKRKAAESGMMVGNSFKYYEEPTEDQANPSWNHLVPGVGLAIARKYIDLLFFPFDSSR